MELNPRSEDAPRRRPAMSARCVMRVLSHSELGTVLVYEPEVKGGACALVFENDTFYQKVLTYPSDWRRLSDVDLVGIMENAQV